MRYFRLMALPVELRNNIYEYCLVIPGNIVHLPESYSYDRILDYKDRKLTDFLSLLFLSKRIHDEAAPIFYGKNSFRVTATVMDLRTGGILDRSADWSWSDSQHWDEPYHIDTVWVRKGHLIRHATVHFHQQDLDPQETTLRTQEAHEDQLLLEFERRDLIHEGNIDAMFEVWRFKGAALSHLINLATLDVDIKWLYCATGCCRDDMVRSLWDALTDFITIMSPDLKFRVHGVRGKTESDSAEGWCLAMEEAIRKNKVEIDEAKAKKREEAKAELEMAEAELEEAQAKFQNAEVERDNAEAEWEDADAEVDQAKLKMEEVMKQQD